MKRLDSAITDPHDKKEFWENIKRLKSENPRFSIYNLFPRSENATKRAMNECCEAVFSKTVKIEELPEVKEVNELAELFGSLIDEGKHLSKREESA